MPTNKELFKTKMDALAASINAKAGTSGDKTIDELKDAVDGIVIGVTPTGNQDISTLDEYDVASKATARISAAERAKIIPENIADGVTIFGVTGTALTGNTVTDFKGGTLLQENTVCMAQVYDTNTGEIYLDIYLCANGYEKDRTQHYGTWSVVDDDLIYNVDEQNGFKFDGGYTIYGAIQS